MSVNHINKPKEAWYSITSKIVGMVLGVIALASMAVSAILLLSGLFELPNALTKQAEQIKTIREDVTNLTVAFNSSRPEVLSIIGTGIASQTAVRQGDSIIFVYSLRRNISCDTQIDIQFWDHNKNLIASDHSYTRATNKAPVTPKHIHYAVHVKIPENLPPGVYSYAPVIKPQDCGVYSEQTLPLSEKFRVLSNGTD